MANDNWEGIEKWMAKVDATLEKVAQGLFMVAEHDKDIDEVKADVKELQKNQVEIEKQLIPLQGRAKTQMWIERVVWLSIAGSLLGVIGFK